MKGFEIIFILQKRGFYVPPPFPKFLDKKIDPVKADLLSRPMRYHTEEDRQAMISGEVKRAKKKKKKVLEDE